MIPDEQAKMFSGCLQRLSEELDGVVTDGSRILLLHCGHCDLVRFLLSRGALVSIHFFKDMPDVHSLTDQFGDKVTIQIAPAGMVNYRTSDFDIIVSDNVPTNKWYSRWLIQQLYRFLKEQGHLYLVQGCAPPFTLGSLISRLYSYELDVCNLFLDRCLVNPSFPLSRISKLKFSFSTIFHKKALLCCRKTTAIKKAVRLRVFEDFKGTLKEWKKQNSKPVCELRQWIDRFPKFQNVDVSILNTSEFCGQSILVLSPHPDDEIIGCGGSLLRFIADGAYVTILQMTTGQYSRALKNVEPGEAVNIRPAEAKRVADYLGVDRLIQWPSADSKGWDHNNVNQLKDLIAEIKPKLIFLPFVNDPHADHWASNLILGKSLSALPEFPQDMQIIGYEVWSLLKPDCAVIIDAELNQKETALLEYVTALKAVDYIKSCRISTAYNGYKYLGQNCFAEAFLKLPVDEYLRILQEQSQWKNGN